MYIYKDLRSFIRINKYAMKKILFSTLILIQLSCGNDNSVSENTSNAVKIESSEKQNSEILSSEFLGNYHGIQPSYNLKNKFGDDLVINGKKVPIPSIDYKFLLKENNQVSLQQINLDDNSRDYYEGTYKIISEENNSMIVECSLSDGQTSNPVYVLTIDKIDKKGLCTGANEPEFNIEITK